MKKIVFGGFTFAFALFFIFFTQSTYAEVCPGVSVRLEPTPLLTTSSRARITVSTPSDCFVLNQRYSYAVWFENENVGGGNTYRGNPTDRRTFIAEWNVAGVRVRPGAWHFSLWFGSGPNERQDNRLIVRQYNFPITYPGGNPSIAPKQPAYQVGESPTFVVSNAQTGRDYTFWWDGDQTARQEVRGASSTSFEIGPIPPPNNNPGNKRFCMYPGGVNSGSVRGISCEFSTNVTFTVGPPPAGGGPGGGRTPIGPIDLNKGCSTNAISTAIGCIPYGDPNSFAAWFLKWAIGIAGGIAFLLIIFSGFQIMTASNNPQQLQTGRELLTAAVSGLILIIFSAFLLKLIGVDILGIPGLGQ